MPPRVRPALPVPVWAVYLGIGALLGLDLTLNGWPALLPWVSLLPLLVLVRHVFNQRLPRRLWVFAALGLVVPAAQALLAVRAEQVFPGAVAAVALVTVGMVHHLRSEDELTRRVEELQEQSEDACRRFERLLERSPSGVGVIAPGPPPRWVFGVGKFRSMLGLSEDDCPVGAELTRVHPHDRPRLMSPGLEPETDFRILDGADRWRVFSASWVDGHGVPGLEGNVVNFHDVTEQRRVAAALFEADNIYRGLVDVLEDGVALLGPDGAARFVNRRLAAMTGLPAGALIDAPAAGWVHCEDADRFTGLLASALLGERASGSLRLRDPDPDGTPVLVSASPIREQSGVVSALVVAFTDVGPLTSAQQTVADARLEASLALAARDDLLSQVSHELRTPLTPIMAYSELILHDPGNFEQVEDAAAAIFTAAEHLRLLVDGLLDLSHRRAEAAELTLAPVELWDALEEAVRLAGGDLHEAADVRWEPAVPVQVLAERERLVQILVNLVANALHHGRTPVQVGVETGDGAAVVTVADQGPGIPSGDRERVFAPFVRLNTAPAPSGRRSTGLGLAIVRQLADAIGARVAVEPSEVGARFSVRLPLAPPI